MHVRDRSCLSFLRARELTGDTANPRTLIENLNPSWCSLDYMQVRHTVRRLLQQHQSHFGGC